MGVKLNSKTFAFHWIGVGSPVPTLTTKCKSKMNARRARKKAEKIVETNVALDLERVSPEKAAPSDFKDGEKGAEHGKHKNKSNDKNLLIASYVAFDFEPRKKYSQINL